jgi:hypothetical protein
MHIHALTDYQTETEILKKKDSHLRSRRTEETKSRKKLKNTLETQDFSELTLAG